MKKYLIIASIVLAVSKVYAGGSTDFPKHQITKCEGSGIAVHLSHSIGTEKSSAEELLESGDAVVRISDQRFNDTLIELGLISSFGVTGKIEPNVLSMILDRTNLARYLMVQGSEAFQPSYPLISSEGKTTPVFEGTAPRKYLQVRAQAVSADQVQIDVLVVLSEVRKCTRKELEKNPWVPGEMFEVCKQSVQLFPEMAYTAHTETYSAPSCRVMP